jgi:hypothetical protein
MIGDGQRVAVVTVAELELALEVSAPQIVGRHARGQVGYAGARAGSANAFDQAVPMQHGVDGALGRDAHVLVQAANQELANLARAPMGLLALERDDQALDLRRQLIGIADRPARPIA